MRFSLFRFFLQGEQKGIWASHFAYRVAHVSSARTSAKPKRSCAAGDCRGSTPETHAGNNRTGKLFGGGCKAPFFIPNAIHMGQSET